MVSEWVGAVSCEWEGSRMLLRSTESRVLKVWVSPRLLVCPQALPFHWAESEMFEGSEKQSQGHEKVRRKLFHVMIGSL